MRNYSGSNFESSEGFEFQEQNQASFNLLENNSFSEFTRDDLLSDIDSIPIKEEAFDNSKLEGDLLSNQSDEENILNNSTTKSKSKFVEPKILFSPKFKPDAHHLKPMGGFSHFPPTPLKGVKRTSLDQKKGEYKNEENKIIPVSMSQLPEIGSPQDLALRSPKEGGKNERQYSAKFGFPEPKLITEGKAESSTMKEIDILNLSESVSPSQNQLKKSEEFKTKTGHDKEKNNEEAKIGIDILEPQNEETQFFNFEKNEFEQDKKANKSDNIEKNLFLLNLEEDKGEIVEEQKTGLESPKMSKEEENTENLRKLEIEEKRRIYIEGKINIY